MPIELKNVSYIYDRGTPNESEAISNIDLTFREGEFVGIIGHTGSGKSTLIQHLNGLVKPTSGQILFNGEDIFKQGTKKKGRKAREENAAQMLKIRQKVGLVFQYPEHQLFEMTVGKDIAFGPSNMALDEAEIERRVNESMAMVGLPPEVKDKSPFELSGGQKRRVAIAGVLAMSPDFLILDEPTAGLDPYGREEILEQLSKLKRESKITIILVSHSMDDVARFADRIIAMDQGKVRFDGTPEEVFCHGDELRDMGLDIPKVTLLGDRLRKKGWFKELTTDKAILDLDHMEAAVLQELGKDKRK